MDRADIYMTAGCAVCLPLAVAAYELGYPFTGTALCIASGVCMLLAIRRWTRSRRNENGTALGRDTGAGE